MGERPDLDLSGILTNFNMQWLVGDTDEPVRDVPEKDGLRFPVPQRLGAGPDVWSACTELAVPIVLRWDVNGYYRALGVSPTASRKELREAYQALDGQSSAYLTYVFKQLLDPEMRAAYDAAPLGEPFLDQLTQREMRRRAREAARRRSTILGRDVTADEVMDEWGYTLIDDEDDRGAEMSAAGVDSVSPTRQDHSRQAERMEYSYYGWRTTRFLLDEKVLQRWQEALTSAAAQLGIAPKLSFGITSVSDQPYILEQVGAKQVLFFPEGSEPTEEVAREAISELTKFPTHS